MAEKKKPTTKGVPGDFTLRESTGDWIRHGDNQKLGQAGSNVKTKFYPRPLEVHHLRNVHPDMTREQAEKKSVENQEKGETFHPGVRMNIKDTDYNRHHWSNPDTGYNTIPSQNTQPSKPVLTEQQKRWADIAKQKNSQPPSFKGVPYLMPAKNEGVARSTTNPYSGTRAQNIENAKAAGEFEGIRKDYNQRNKTTGHSMNENGDIDYNAANNLQGRQNLIEQTPRLWDTSVRNGKTASGAEASSTSPQQEVRQGFTNPDIINNARQVSGTASVPNPYGTATATYGGPKQTAVAQNEMGRMVPMNPYLKEQAEVQNTKYGPMQGYSENQNPYQASAAKQPAEGIPSFVQTKAITPKQKADHVEEMAKLAEESEDEGEEGGEENVA